MTCSLFLRRARWRPAFTLVELLVVLAIIALLASLALPNFSTSILKAKSVDCAQNLHGIGIAVLSYAADNGEMLPEINQTAPPLPYPATVPGLLGVLGPYGLTTNSIQCPVDMSSGVTSSFSQYGSSYEWNPVLDDGADPVTTIALGPIDVSVNMSRVRVCTDFVSIHHGKVNALYGDGHTKAR
jgi:prepilin-type N-terminal cleavage/methylation domain-containing protein/prepilin-type processing-associated H-X9-DG protein